MITGAVSTAIVSEASSDLQDAEIVVHSVGVAIAEGLNQLERTFREET